MTRNSDPFKWRHYEAEVILLTVRWYCRYQLSYRKLEEMMRERGLNVDLTTVFRWVVRIASLGSGGGNANMNFRRYRRQVLIDVGDIKERTKSVDGCFICENNEATTIATALHLALSSRQLTNGRHAVVEFEASTLAMKVISVYERALARDSPG